MEFLDLEKGDVVQFLRPYNSKCFGLFKIISVEQYMDGTHRIVGTFLRNGEKWALCMDNTWKYGYCFKTIKLV